MDQKRCGRCTQMKPLDAFSKHKRNPDGLERYCRACCKVYRDEHRDERNAQSRNYYQKHRVDLIQKQQTRYNADLDASRARARAIRNAHAGTYKARDRERYAQNADAERARARAYYAAHRHETSERKKRAYRMNPDAHIERSRTYQAAHPDKARAHRRAYRAAHPQRIRAQKHLRRVRIAHNGGSYTDRDVAHMESMQQGHCAYCWRVIDLTIEHIIPVGRGGSNGPENICLACLRCNLEKGSKLLNEWVKRWYMEE